MVSIAVVGTNFGRDFIPIYASHPDVSRVGICDTDAPRLARVGDELGIADRFASLEELIESGRYDAVHLATPVRLHADQVIATLHAGLHTACAVPMATSLVDIARIIAAQRASGRGYMMMETSVYGREFFYVKQLYDAPPARGAGRRVRPQHLRRPAGRRGRRDGRDLDGAGHLRARLRSARW